MAELAPWPGPTRAAFEYADAEGAGSLAAELQLIAAVVDDARVQDLLSDPALTTEAQAEAFRRPVRR
jgi:F0F1-type ATP synthase delta subunit